MRVSAYPFGGNFAVIRTVARFVERLRVGEVCLILHFPLCVEGILVTSRFVLFS